MLIIGNYNDFKKASSRHVNFKKVPCRISLRPKKGSVAMSIKGSKPPHWVLVVSGGIWTDKYL